MPRMQWNDLTAGQRRGIALGGIVQIALLVAALIDIRRRPADEIKGSKLLWTALACINFVGPIAYFIFGRKR
jgi:hypothetical protein